jgi:SAM-dependent methyltransferase
VEFSKFPAYTPVVPDQRTVESENFLSGSEIHEQWESDYLNQDLDPFYERAFEWIASQLGERTQTVLDAGCGYCIHAARLVRRGFQVTGLDFSPSALGAASRYLKQCGLEGKVSLRQGDLLALPFADGQFDAVTCWGVLMHIPDLERALLELLRVVAPGGRLVLMENNCASLHVRFWEPALRSVKRVLHRTVPEVRRTPRGVEEWYQRETAGLMVRKTNIDWLVGFLAKHDARLATRHAGQMTEIFTSLRPRALKRVVYRLNRTWFDRGGSPGLALGNILVFEKRA